MSRLAGFGVAAKLTRVGLSVEEEEDEEYMELVREGQRVVRGDIGLGIEV